MKNSGFRHEMKYIISTAEKEILCRQLQTILPRDLHADDGKYEIRSLYFDTRDYDAYNDKLAGIEEREKYRIRIYDQDDSVIKLECKKKLDNYIKKSSVTLTRAECDAIINGDVACLVDRPELICRTFREKVLLEGLKPVVIVDYKREPFVYSYGDVRITFDSELCAGINTEIFDFDSSTIPVMEEQLLVMEVKYTEFLPDIVRDVLSVQNSIYTAYSKYTMCVEKRNELRNLRLM